MISPEANMEYIEIPGTFEGDDCVSVNTDYSLLASVSTVNDYYPSSQSINAEDYVSMQSVTNNNLSLPQSINNDNYLSLSHSIGIYDKSSSSESTTTDLLTATIEDDITVQLAMAGPTGIAAAAAITSSNKRKNSFSFETNPVIRKRQRTRLLKKLRRIIDDFTDKFELQAVIIIATPGQTNKKCEVFGAKPLKDIMMKFQTIIIQDLETALIKEISMPSPQGNLFDLPPVTMDGIPITVETMTQSHLRAFIPFMLKYSTKRIQPGWGKKNKKPEWWPDDIIPWVNVRMDSRTIEQKQMMSFSDALRQVVLNCYRYHNREDLLPVFNKKNDTNITNDNPDQSENLLQICQNNSVMTLPVETTHIQELQVIHKIKAATEEALSQDNENTSSNNYHQCVAPACKYQSVSTDTNYIYNDTKPSIHNSGNTQEPEIIAGDAQQIVLQNEISHVLANFSTFVELSSLGHC